MPKYQILIKYSTGDSFTNEDTQDYIDLSWNNLDNAKENLIRIKEHYDMYQSINSYSLGRKKSRESIFNENIDKDWFVNVPLPYYKETGQRIYESDISKLDTSKIKYIPDEYHAEHCLSLVADNGNKMMLRAFYCGYFENMYSAEIVIDDSDMKINF